MREDETYLWPSAVSSRRQTEASRAELVALYPHRADVPPSLWRTLIDQVQQDLAILVYRRGVLTRAADRPGGPAA